MIKHSLVQGSKEWHLHRANYKNASDAAAMLNISPYKTRDELLYEKWSGITPEITAKNQQIFDDGHRFEALARPLAEIYLGDDLFPEVITEGDFSASLDGRAFSSPIIWECKTLNAAIRQAFAVGEIPEYIRVQTESQLMIDQWCEKVLVTASEFDENDELIEIEHRWYERDPVLADRITKGWAQFDEDLKNYQPPAQAAQPVAQPAVGLPALFIQVEGRIVESNLPYYKQKWAEELENVEKLLYLTDDDFAFADERAKDYRAGAKNLRLVKKAMLDQTITIGEAVRDIDFLDESMNAAALKIEKKVEANKTNIKNGMINAGKNDWQSHIDALNANISPLKITVSAPDFGGAIKGGRSPKAWQNSVNSALAAKKIEAGTQAQAIASNLAVYKYVSDQYSFLFSDLKILAYKPLDEFQVIVTGRIDQHKQIEQERLAKEKAAIEAEAALKEQARQAAVVAEAERKRLDNERMRLDAERKTKEKEEALEAEIAASKAENLRLQTERDTEAARFKHIHDDLAQANATNVANDAERVAESGYQSITDEQVITSIVDEFDITFDESCNLIIRVAENMRVAA